MNPEIGEVWAFTLYAPHLNYLVLGVNQTHCGDIGVNFLSLEENYICEDLTCEANSKYWCKIKEKVTMPPTKQPEIGELWKWNGTVCYLVLKVTPTTTGNGLYISAFEFGSDRIVETCIWKLTEEFWTKL